MRTQLESGSVNKVWLITGSCRALVRALAEALLASGHNLLLATTEDSPSLRDLGERYGEQLHVAPIEVTCPLTAESAIQATVGAFGRLDVLVLDTTKWGSGGSLTLWLRNRGHVLKKYWRIPREDRVS